jgi:hypothetical protein
MRTSLLSLVVGVLGMLAARAHACSCPPRSTEPIVIPGLKTADGRDYRASLNTRVWVIGDNLEDETFLLRAPSGQEVEVEVEVDLLVEWFGRLKPLGRRSVVSLNPRGLQPNTSYRVYRSLAEREALIGTFLTGDQPDTTAPARLDEPQLTFRHGNYGSSCDYGNASALVKLHGGADAETPPDFVLYRVAVVGSAPPFRTFMPGAALEGARVLWLNDGAGMCRLQNFEFPPPLAPAMLEFSVLDPAGNESERRQVSIVGPHTAESLEMLGRLRAEAKASTTNSCPAPAVHSPPPSRTWRWLPIGLGVFVLGVAAGFGLVRLFANRSARFQEGNTRKS